MWRAGPFVGMLGPIWAPMVKLEPPGGDNLRRQPFLMDSDDSEFSLNCASVNRSKRSIYADLKDPSGDRVLALSDAFE